MGFITFAILVVLFYIWFASLVRCMMLMHDLSPDNYMRTYDYNAFYWPRIILRPVVFVASTLAINYILRTT